MCINFSFWSVISFCNLPSAFSCPIWRLSHEQTSFGEDKLIIWLPFRLLAAGNKILRRPWWWSHHHHLTTVSNSHRTGHTWAGERWPRTHTWNQADLGSNAALTLGKLSNLYEPLFSPSVTWQESLCYKLIISMRQHNVSLAVGSQQALNQYFCSDKP